MTKKQLSFCMNFRFLAGLYIVIGIMASLQKYFLGEDSYGNYLIFKNSFFHLLNQQDLYVQYPNLKIDLFKYSPTFALLFFPFAYLPDVVGMILWNLLGVILFLFALRRLEINEKSKIYLLYFVLIEVVTTLQNFQSNLFTAALMVMVFVLLERKSFWLAGICVALGFYIKLLGSLVVLLWFLYSEKKVFFISTLIFSILLLVSPLLLVTPAELYNLYKSWFNLLANDTPHFLNHSVLSVLKNWFSMNISPVVTQITGLCLLVLPLMRYKQFYDYKFRMIFLCSILIWSVIFNHKAESATYIIAVIGCALWFFSSEITFDKVVLMSLLFILSTLSPTDIIPRNIRENYVVPYSLKALPCILIWIRIQYDLLFFRKITRTS